MEQYKLSLSDATLSTMLIAGCNMQIMVMLEDFHDPAPVGAELEEFLAHPKHHLARLIRDLFADEAAPTTMEVK